MLRFIMVKVGNFLEHRTYSMAMIMSLYQADGYYMFPFLKNSRIYLLPQHISWGLTGGSRKEYPISNTNILIIIFEFLICALNNDLDFQ